MISLCFIITELILVCSKNKSQAATISERTYPRLCSTCMILLSFANFIIFSFKSPVRRGSFRCLEKCFKAECENLLAYSLPHENPPYSQGHLTKRSFQRKFLVLLHVYCCFDSSHLLKNPIASTTKYVRQFSVDFVLFLNRKCISIFFLWGFFLYMNLPP